MMSCRTFWSGFSCTPIRVLFFIQEGEMIAYVPLAGLRLLAEGLPELLER